MNLEGLMHAERYGSMSRIVYIPKKEQVLNSHLHLYLRLCTSRNGRKRQSFKLSSWTLTACSNIIREILHIGWETHRNQAFREISSHLLPDYLANWKKTTVAAHNRKQRLYKITSRTSLNKQKAITTNPVR